MSEFKKDFIIVGMGASAGGLEAFQNFFSKMSSDSGMAFVLVQHLDPNHESLMPELLSKSTEMPVSAVKENMEVLPNNVYVIPPNASLTIKDNILHISKPIQPRGQRMSIDHFFTSLSENSGEHSICIVFSGTGSDGTLGLKAVKEHGGLAIVQNPETAKYDSMPRSAIQTGLVDMVLNIEEMSENIQNYGANLFSFKTEMEDDKLVEDLLASIFKSIKKRTGHEFTGYKRTTIMRRIRRRMQVLHIDSISKYADRLKADHQESNSLFKDLLIGVTHFFRDAEAFKLLKKEIIPQILKKKMEAANPLGVRIWVPGCATGEEAYSLAFLFREAASELNYTLPIQIFATDIDESALETARRAVYPEGISEQMDSKYLDRFFIKQGSYYKVHKEIREMCIFSPHNLIKDPPFSRLDLITCRNLLIYFEQHLQKKLLPIFHYALAPEGYLFLGPSENISARPELFKTINKFHRIFKAKKNVTPVVNSFPFSLGIKKTRDDTSINLENRKNNLAQIFEKRIFDNYIPFSAVINESADIMYWAGPLAKYLEPPPGVPHNNLIEMAHKTLRLSLRSLIHKSVSQGKEFTRNDLIIKTPEGLQKLMMVVSPLHELGQENNLYLVVIRELGLPISDEEAKNLLTRVDSQEEVTKQLEEELRNTKEFLQTTVEELETTNEELKSSNEELLSMNEELQSSNEELQTSKEELQSVNEELETVNTELKKKVEELDDANSDLTNLFESTQIATIFLDNDLVIRGYTPAATELLRIKETDVGRSIEDIVRRFENGNIAKEARSVLSTLEKRRTEIKNSESDNSYVMQITPYRTVNNKIDGVTISFIDVTEINNARRDLEIRQTILSQVTNSVPVLISYLDTNERYLLANARHKEWFGLSEEELKDMRMNEVVSEESYQIAKPHIEKVLKGQSTEFETPITLKNGKQSFAKVNYEPHIDKDGKVVGFVALIQDESERILRERKMGRLAAIVNSSHEVIIGKTKEGIITDWNKGAEQLYGYNSEEAVGKSISLIIPPFLENEMKPIYERVRKGEIIEPFETVRVTKEGKIKEVYLSISPITGENGKVLGISAVAHDISERVKAEKELESLNKDLEKRVKERTKQLRNLTSQLLNLEQAERRKFSQMLHDELQQLLVAAKMLLQQIDGSLEDEQLKKSLHRALKILEDAIKESRSITMELSPPLFFDRGITTSFEWLVRWAKEKYNLDVELNFEGEDRPVSEEAGYFVFRSTKELLFNIFKHADVKTATIQVEFKKNSNFILKVTDKGEGFEDNNLLEPDGKYGLASMKQSLGAMGGDILIESKLGKGTTVIIKMPESAISIPVKSSLIDEPKKSERKKVIRKKKSNQNGKYRLLLVDDQKPLRYALRLMLEDRSNEFEFFEAEDGDEAIEKVKKIYPDVILMDISMPGMNGIEATQKIKAEYEDIKIIGLSMHDKKDIESEMLKAGASGYLTKDAPTEEIIASIHKTLKEN